MNVVKLIKPQNKGKTVKKKIAGSNIIFICVLALTFVGCSDNENDENRNSGNSQSNVTSDGPTRQETYDFLVGKMDGSWSLSRPNDSWKYLHYFSGSKGPCTITYMRVNTREKPRVEEHTKITIPLKSVNPESVKVEGGNNSVSYVSIATTNGYNDILCEGDFCDAPKISKVTINVLTKDADKVAKAMTHLVKLCGGKAELF
ncbi:hypothetical protein [Marinobacter fuscus]|uniref:hypothetical protein n=1 Tax=Marinobacter fuscus TaxID=2109942 RepID=UPI001057498A|nr:hypothetical protein [Marinobacter fuscus]